MGYLHINNLYKDQLIFNFKTCYALEKIHGTSAHIAWNGINLIFFSGGEKHDRFVKLFNQEELTEKFKNYGFPPDKMITVYGEAYGGSQQGMSETYGKDLKFIAFDVEIGDCWLDVPTANRVCDKLGIEFVHWVEIPTDIKEIDAQRDADSVQAIRNGVGPGKKREGVVLRPSIEVTLNNGNRLICKHKRDEFRETKSPRVVQDPEKLRILNEAQQIADEWVTVTRLEHVLDKIPGHCMEKMRDIIGAMTEDVLREGQGEIIDTKEARTAISRSTAVMYKAYLNKKLTET